MQAYILLVDLRKKRIGATKGWDVTSRLAIYSRPLFRLPLRSFVSTTSKLPAAHSPPPSSHRRSPSVNELEVACKTQQQQQLHSVALSSPSELLPHPTAVQPSDQFASMDQQRPSDSVELQTRRRAFHRSSFLRSLSSLLILRSFFLSFFRFFSFLSRPV